MLQGENGNAFRRSVYALIVCLWMPSVRAQATAAGEVWDELAARATIILACRSPEQGQIDDPGAAAVALFDKALAELDQSRTLKADEQKRRGAARARIVKDRDDLLTKRRIWGSALQDSSKSFQLHALDRADSSLSKGNPIACSSAFEMLRTQIAETRKAANAAFQEGERLFARAQSSFDLEEAASLSLDAVAKFKEAQALNVDDPTPAKRIADAVRLHADLTASFSKHELMILSDPGGARLVVKGEKKERVCPATPCRVVFDPSFFDDRGGSFLNSPRLTAPLIAQLSKEGFRSEVVTLTEGPHDLTFRVPGRRITLAYYYLSKTRFEIRLTPLDSAPNHSARKQ